MMDFLLRIDGEVVPNISKYTIGYNKLWADAERNMNGDVSATLIGIFPKIELEIGGVLTTSVINTLCELFNRAYFEAEFTDPATNQKYTGRYYASDYSVELLDKARMLYKPFTINLIPVSKRI